MAFGIRTVSTAGRAIRHLRGLSDADGRSGTGGDGVGPPDARPGPGEGGPSPAPWIGFYRPIAVLVVPELWVPPEW